MIAMTRRFLGSRGVRRFRKNRMAMASLVVIVLYILLAGWIVAMNSLQAVGVPVDRHPLFGLLLTSSTLDRAGPGTLAGFGVKQSVERRGEHHAFFLDRLGQAFEEIDRLGADSDRTPRELLGQVSVAERDVADLPLEELQEIYERGRERFDEVVELRRQAGEVGRLIALRDRLAELTEEVSEAARGAGESDGAMERFEKQREELAFSIEEVGYSIEDLRAGMSDAEAFERVDVDALFAAAEALFDAGPEHFAEGPPYDESVLETATEAGRESRAALQARIEKQTDSLEPIVEKLFPVPDGLGGAIYRARLLLGTDRQGRSILVRSLYSAKIAIQVGVVTALVAVIFGSMLGAAAAFLGGWVDHGVMWLYSIFTSVPSLVLLVLLAFMFTGSAVDNTLIPLYAAFSLTFWIGPCRVIRGEAMKIKELEYVQAATAIGFGRLYILVKHVIPNTAHLMFINFSLLFIGAIKGEVILTFLNLGLKEGASWGIMISQSASEVVSGFFWQIGAATFFMFVLVLAFNIFTDALQDAFDPKHV